MLQDWTYIFFLVLTLGCEGPVIGIGFGRIQKPKLKIFLVFLFSNLFTHGLLWALWALLPGIYWIKLVIAELVIWLIEAVVYAFYLKATFLRAGVVSGLANLFSTLVGLLVWWVG